MSKKKVLSIVIGLVAILTAVSFITYAIATSGKGNKQQIASEVTNYGLGAGYSYTSNIDLIIQNSKEGETFNIIEIMPNGQNASDLSKYIADGYFKKYVIDENSSDGEKMASGMIKYDAITVNPTTDLAAEVSSNILGTSTLQELLDAADLIYVSSQYYTSYDGTNNMSEKVYNFLHTYALGSNKPIIMDYVRKTDTPSALENKTYSTLVNLISNNHIRFRTFGWDTASLEADQFFQSEGSSYYMRYPLDKMRATGKVLIITKNSGSAAMYGKLTSSSADLKNLAYYGSGAPAGAFTSSCYTIQSPTQLDAMANLDSLGDYDFIFIEKDVAGDNISDAVFSQLRALSESSKYIIYDSGMISGSGSSGGVDTVANNYLQLMDLLISNKGLAKYSHVLPVSNGFFTSLYNTAKDASLEAASIASAKAIADIINGGDYRGSLMDGSNGKKFRVLELQPCYPIDLELALKQGNMDKAVIYNKNGLKGNYYTDPGNVLEGKTQDEIEEETEFYKFELSKAKLVKALGLRYDQIELDQMSTEAFISDKNVVSETYDLVYIGGNHSALTPTINRAPFASTSQMPSSYFTYLVTSSLIPSYEMYFHNGFPSNYYAYRFGGGYQDPVYGVTGETAIVQTNGNDLTLTKYNELIAYINAGMPILFSDEVSQAFEWAYVGKEDNRMAQMNNGQLDPDSRMFYVLKYAYEKKDWETVVWNMNIADKADAEDYYFNADSQYGNTLGSYVHLFDKDTDTNQKILTAVEAGAPRPSFQIVSKPSDYIQGNESTYNENKDGSMSITISLNADLGYKCTATLYVDADANGTFDESEIATYGLSEEKQIIPISYGDVKELKYSFPDEDFYGLVSWKIIVTAPAPSGEGVICDMRYGYSYFKRKDDVDEKEIRVLQIMPVEGGQGGSYAGGQDTHSLYLCTECQQAKYPAVYNLDNNGNLYANITGNARTTTSGNIYLGLHEHKFGIVKYDTAAKKIASADIDGAGSEDWDYNFADEIEDDYNFDIDILLLDDLEQYTELVRKYYSFETDEDGNIIQTTSSEITEDPFDSTAVVPAGTLAEDYFAAKTEEYEGKWEDAKTALERSGVETKLAEYLRNVIAQKNTLYATGGDQEGVSAGDIENWIMHRAFYKYFWYARNANYDDPEYVTLYSQWVQYNDEIVKYHQLRNKYSCMQYSSEEWMLKNYDCVVLGFADEFNFKDLNVDECDDIRTYLQRGGTIFLTHDCTTRYRDVGSVTLTRELRDAFGLDRYHVSYKNNVWQEDPDETPVSTINGYSEHNPVVLRVDNGAKIYGPVTLGKNNVTVDIVLNDIDPVPVKDGNNTTYEFYKPFRMTATDNNPVPVGSRFEITFNFYDTVEDALAGNPRSTALNGKNCQLGYVTLYPGFASDNTSNTISNGTVKMTCPDNDWSGYLKSKTITANNTLIYRKFALNGYKTLPDSNVVDPTKTKYYFTELSMIGSDGESRAAFDYYVKKLAMASSSIGTTGSYIDPIGVTDTAVVYRTEHLNTSPYKYVEYDMVKIFSYNRGENNVNAAGTIRASKVNDGIITVYPFKISDELKISPTHAQTFALDLEDTNANAWFTMSGASYGGSDAKNYSSMFAASPYDGMDNYFLYSFQYGQGTVNYAGAGNAVITGPGKNNNDERRLFLNVIVNSVRNKGGKPKITVHEKDKPNKDLQPVGEGQSPNTNPFINSGGDYEYSVNSKDETPEFDYKIKINSQTKFKEIYVFYDLNFGADYSNGTEFVSGDSSSQYSADAAHVLIYHFGGTDAQYAADSKAKKIQYQTDEDGNKSKNIIIGSLRKDMYGTGTADPLALKPSYFDPYGGTYTYIVIWTKDADGNTAYKRVKISLVPLLFDLTDNTTIQQPIYYFEKNTDVLDAIDKLKFDL